MNMLTYAVYRICRLYWIHDGLRYDPHQRPPRRASCGSWPRPRGSPWWPLLGRSRRDPPPPTLPGGGQCCLRRLRAGSGRAWEAVERERRAWDATLADGLTAPKGEPGYGPQALARSGAESGGETLRPGARSGWPISTPRAATSRLGRRPVLVVSENLFNQGPAGLVIVLPMTSTLRGVPSHVPVSPPEGGVRKATAILCDAVRRCRSSGWSFAGARSGPGLGRRGGGVKNKHGDRCARPFALVSVDRATSCKTGARLIDCRR